MPDDGIDFDGIMESVEQYAEQRATGSTFEQANAAVEIRRALEKNDIDVDEVRFIGLDPSVMYYHDERKRDVVTIALVAAKATQYITDVMAVTALESETERCGHFRIERDWIDEYNDGDLTKKAYAKRVLDTWEEM